MSYEDKTIDQLREEVAALEPTLDLRDWSREMLEGRLDQFYADESDLPEEPFSVAEHTPTAGVRENTSDEEGEEEDGDDDLDDDFDGEDIDDEEYDEEYDDDEDDDEDEDERLDR